MLQAARQAARKDMQKQRLTIQNEELGFYANNIGMVSGNSAMFAGFALDSLSSGDGDVPADANRLAVSVMLFCFALALANNLCSLLTGTFCSIQAPGLALRGGGDAMNRACVGIRSEHKWTLAFHLSGLLAYLIGLGIMATLRLPVAQGVTICTVFVLATALGIVRVRRMQQGLYISKAALRKEAQQALAGLNASDEHRLEAAQAVARAELMEMEVEAEKSVPKRGSKLKPKAEAETEMNANAGPQGTASVDASERVGLKDGFVVVKQLDDVAQGKQA